MTKFEHLQNEFQIEHLLVFWRYLELQISNKGDSKCSEKLRELSTTFMKTPKAESIVFKVQNRQHGSSSGLHGPCARIWMCTGLLHGPCARKLTHTGLLHGPCPWSVSEHLSVFWEYLEVQMSKWDDSKCYGKLRELSTTFMKRPKAESIILKVEFIQQWDSIVCVRESK